MENRLGQALVASAPKNGWQVEIVDRITNVDQYDVVGIIGVRNVKLIHACAAAGKPYLYFDKGYNRKPNWWRMSWCAHNPSDYLLGLKRSSDRMRIQKWKLAPWQNNTRGHILICGSSAKFHNVYGLPNPNTYWAEAVKYLRQTEYAASRRIIYRPKKSYHDAVPIRSTVMSTEDSIYDDLKDAAVMITTGSNSCFEAMEVGVPAVVLGAGVTRLISSTKLADVGDPYRAPIEDRECVFRNLAYFQYKVDEIAEGAHWGTINDCIQLREALPTPTRG